MDNLLQQLSEQKKKVDFNTYDMTTKELMSLVEDGTIDIAPDYQRQFRWDEDRQSLLIESIFLGIPVPSLFMATNANSTWEVIDGVQRLSTIINFISSSDSNSRKKIKKEIPLKISGLEKLTYLNGYRYDELPSSVKLEFALKPIKVITLTDKSDMSVRFDLFERLNTGGVKLSDQEIRNCVYRGRFIDFLKQLSKNQDFKRVTKKPDSAKNDGTMEELILRFFAYLYKRNDFDHSVKIFLNDYISEGNSLDFIKEERFFSNVFHQLAQLPYGIVKSEKSSITSTILWEAVAIGAADAINSGKEKLNLDGFYEWVKDAEFNKLITGATNSRTKLIQRIDFAREKFMR